MFVSADASTEGGRFAKKLKPVFCSMKSTLVLIDCDRTLLNDSGIVTERTKTAISNAVRNGVKTVFASGRAPGGIENMVKAIGEEHLFEYFVCFNGGLIIRAHDKQVVSESSLTIDDVIHIVDSICCKPEDYYVLTSGRLICQGYNKQAESPHQARDQNRFVGTGQAAVKGGF